MVDLGPLRCIVKPAPGDYLSGPCPGCGHLLALHVGCRDCPVCELVALNQHARTLTKINIFSRRRLGR